MGEIVKYTQVSALTKIEEGKMIVASASPEEAWTQGVNIRRAVREHPKQVKFYLFTELGKLIRFIDAKKTLENEDDLIFTVDALIETFPAFKLEEFSVVFHNIKLGYFGKFYERLKTAELIECCKQWEGQRAEIIERQRRWNPDPDFAERTSGPVEIKKALTLTEKDIKIIEQNTKK